VLSLVAVALVQTGCVTSKKYKLAKEDVPPARALGWSVAAPPAQLTLATLIVFKGPGSWKREAKWDEYVVQLTNTGDRPLAIEGAELHDLMGEPQAPGIDPWQLEKQSATNWDKYGKNGLKLLAGAGAVALYIGSASAIAATSALSGAAAGGAVALLNVIPIVALVDVTAVAVMNRNNRAKVVAEYDRRRLVLPLTLAPNSKVEGSLFFPMTPGPQRLVFRGRSGEAPMQFGLELKPLAGLHLKPGQEKSTAR